jgi:hypothetical protein
MQERQNQARGTHIPLGAGENRRFFCTVPPHRFRRDESCVALHFVAWWHVCFKHKRTRLPFKMEKGSGDGYRSLKKNETNNPLLMIVVVARTTKHPRRRSGHGDDDDEGRRRRGLPVQTE